MRADQGRGESPWLTKTLAALTFKVTEGQERSNTCSATSDTKLETPSLRDLPKSAKVRLLQKTKLTTNKPSSLSSTNRTQKP